MATDTTQVLGQPLDRVDGRAKVTGRADYAADHHFEGLAHAVGLFSTIGCGRIQQIDTSGAEQAPGVLGVLHRGNVPKLYRSPNDMEEDNRVGEARPPFEDDNIYYSGQFVAAVVAETYEQARDAAGLVRVTYETQPPVLTLDAGKSVHGEKEKDDSPDSKRGDPDAHWKDAAVKIDHTYTMPVEVHNPMELHASVAVWQGDKLDAYESTQWVVGQRKALAKVLGVEPEKITVHSPYIGGGFGGKLFLWPHTVIAAVAARKLQRPVKLVVDRKHEFTTVGHRPANRQRVRLAAQSDGRLNCIYHDTLAHTSLVHEFLEECGSNTKSFYACPHVSITHRMIPVNVGTPTSMRAPGAASGLYALESAMDELAIALKMDPVELRLRNVPPNDPDKNRAWGSCYLRECMETVRDRFGWKRRSAAPQSMRDGDELIGWGFAACTWPSHRRKASARVELKSDGTARVSCATQDIGTGTYTVAAQVVAEVTGLPTSKIEVAIGSSSYPEGPISGGSMVTATIVPAIAEATRRAIENLLKHAAKKGPLGGEEAKSLKFENGFVVSTKSGRRASLADVLGAANLASVDGNADTKPGEEFSRFTFKSFGAHAVEVRWHPALARLRVTRVVSAFDCGRIINEKTAKNQIYGSIVMAIGAALMEESVYDARDGHVVTDNIADYLMPVNADTPAMDVTFLNRPDPHIGEFGAKGLGEIGITGIIGGIANAVYHATGVRVRDLPIRMEKIFLGGVASSG